MPHRNNYKWALHKNIEIQLNRQAHAHTEHMWGSVCICVTIYTPNKPIMITIFYIFCELCTHARTHTQREL